MPRAITIALAVLAAPAAATLADLEALMEKQEGLVLELASEVEQQHRLRCGLTVSDCQGMSYDNCGTRYPCQTCPADGLDIAACGTGKGGLFDYTVSSVRLAGTADTDADNNPRADEVKETVCYTRHLDDWFVSTNANNEASQVYGDRLPQMYFGGHNGAFRIYPARHSETCGSYDTRERPWYVAASSGPKDVVIVLDTSGSMSSYDRISLQSTAANDVIDALTIGDHFGVVEFNSGAQTLNPGGRLLQATVENKDSIKALVDNLAAGGGTNFYNGFYAAFDLLDTSTANEFTSNCHTAILFLTDGDGGSTGLYDMINQRNAAHDATVFTYSLGSGANDVVPKQIACETGGLWAEVPDGDDLSSYMTGYYKLLAMGLGDGANEGFTAWVEPYAFSTGGGMGTTVSAPVYDRSASPPMFIGVAGIDYTVDFMQEVAGSSYATVLNALVTQSTARCPDFTISECELQALRKLSGGTEAMCSGECTTLTEIEPTACLGSSDYPSNFWANLDDQGMSYTDRVCCAKDASTSSEGCYIAPVPTTKPTSVPAPVPTQAPTTPKPTSVPAPEPTQAPTSAPVVAGSVTLSGISAADIDLNIAVLQDAIARVAGVETDDVTILSTSSGRRRRLQTDVIVNFEINSANLAASRDVTEQLATAAADPTLVDTAIAEAAGAAGAEAVFAGVTTESLSHDGPTAAPTPSVSDKKKNGNDVMMIIIIVVVILFVFIAGIGIGFWQKSKSAAPQNQTPVASAPPLPPMAVAEPVGPPPPGFVSGAQAAAMARGEEIEAGQPPPPPSKGLGSWFSRAEPEGEAAMAPEPEQAAEAEK